MIPGRNPGGQGLVWQWRGVIEQTVPWFTPVTVIKSPAVNTSAPPVNGAPMYIPRDKVEDEKREEDSRQ